MGKQLTAIWSEVLRGSSVWEHHLAYEGSKVNLSSVVAALDILTGGGQVSFVPHAVKSEYTYTGR